MKMKWKSLLIALGIPLAVGGAGALLSGGMTNYGVMVKPPLSPPGWVFPVVWTVLYLLMGWASWLVWKSDAPREEKHRALILYGDQLAVNFVWPLIFFGAEMYLTALLVLVALWVLILLTIRAFSGINERAGDLLIPYILWVSFAAYLNLGIFLLNR